MTNEGKKRKWRKERKKAIKEKRKTAALNREESVLMPALKLHFKGDKKEKKQLITEQLITKSDKEQNTNH